MYLADVTEATYGYLPYPSDIQTMLMIAIFGIIALFSVVAIIGFVFIPSARRNPRAQRIVKNAVFTLVILALSAGFLHVIGNQ